VARDEGSKVEFHGSDFSEGPIGQASPIRVAPSMELNLEYRARGPPLTQ
jgi:hypothetical protein